MWNNHVTSCHLLIAILCFVFIPSCAIMDEETCKATNWYELGIIDGQNGRDSSLVQEYIDSCAQFTTVNTESYLKGRTEASFGFCTEQNGWSLGMDAWERTDICDDLDENTKASFALAYERGKNIYDAKRHLLHLDSYLNDLHFLMPWSVWRPGVVYDYDYFMRLRPILVTYIEKGEATPIGDYEVYSFNQAMSDDVPDVTLLEQLYLKIRAIKDTEQSISHIRNNSCYQSKAKKCRSRVRCLHETEDNLIMQLQHYINVDSKFFLNVKSHSCY